MNLSNKILKAVSLATVAGISAVSLSACKKNEKTVSDTEYLKTDLIVRSKRFIYE